MSLTIGTYSPLRCEDIRCLSVNEGREQTLNPRLWFYCGRHTHTHTLCTVLNTNDDNQKKIALKLCGQQAPAAWSYRPSKCLLLEAVPFRLLQLKFGTVCQRPSSHRHHCSLSGVNWRLIFFKYRIHTWFSDCLWYRYSGPCSNVVI